jgi:polyisoprenoid-binding protein YceI
METSKTRWVSDPAHSEVQFKAKHLVISTVTGQFNQYTGEIESTGDDFNGAKAHFEASIDSISTNNADRDKHLKSAEFFDAENHPKLIFKNGVFSKKSNTEYQLEGKMTIRGVEKPISLKAEFGGFAEFYGTKKAGFEITGTVSRKDFDLSWNALTEAGGLVVGDEIKLNLNMQFAQQA